MPTSLKKYFFISAILVLLIAAFVLFSYQREKRLEVDFLDVGQGDSILIKTPYDQNILIDGGPNGAVIDRLGENLSFWDRRIDLMILTHPHDDHVFGLIEVLKRYDVRRIAYTGVVHNSPGYIEWLEIVRDKRIPAIIIDRPQTIAFGDDCKLKILYPGNSLAGKEADNLNNTSIVANLFYGDTSLLFMGDAESKVEKELLNKYKINQSDQRNLVENRLKAEVIKISHHGSDTASTLEFLTAVNPNLAVIEVGSDNQFNHPNIRTINRLERLGIKVYRTDQDSSIKMISNGKVISVKAKAKIKSIIARFKNL